MGGGFGICIGFHGDPQFSKDPRVSKRHAMSALPAPGSPLPRFSGGVVRLRAAHTG